MVPSTSDLHNSLRIASAGMSVQNKRLIVVSQNLANVNTKSDKPGGTPYQRKTITFTNERDTLSGVGIVKVKEIGRDQTPFKQVYSPGDPAANADGYILLPNINAMSESMDMREAGSSHEANLKAYEKILKMMEETIGILRN